MKKRYLYSLLFGVPGFVISLIVTALLFAAAAGVLWIFVFGDNPWPPLVEQIAPGLVIGLFLLVWLGFVIAGFILGKRLEPIPGLDRRHFLISLCATLLPILVILFYQLRVGNLGAQTPETRCSAYCLQKGYSASQVSPQNLGHRTCACLDTHGQEMLKLPLDSLPK